MARTIVTTVMTLFAIIVSVENPASSILRRRATAFPTASIFNEPYPVLSSLNRAQATAVMRAFCANKSVVTASASCTEKGNERQHKSEYRAHGKVRMR